MTYLVRHIVSMLGTGLLLASLFCRPSRILAAPAPPQKKLVTTDTCVRVVEGDLIEGKKVGLIRLIGVIAPAKEERGYQEAVDTTRRLALGKRITVEICPERPNDWQDRLRAVVYLPDGTNLNTKLLRLGTARLLERKPCHVDVTTWRAYEESARRGKLGLWAAGTETGRTSRERTRQTRARVQIRPAR
ncbi:MAG: thermonuclease family protein [Armatimonadota bacterium]|nr:thermonuclease family protein [Armatimonadota bacterium]